MRKVVRVIFVLLLVQLILGTAFASVPDQGQEKVYVIPIKGQIGPAIDVFVRDNIEKAQQEGASLIIFDIDTLGGLVQSAVNISKSIRATHIDTVAFVNDNAQSAGVLITISADKVVMAPGSSIGSASTVPETEKNMSYWRGELRKVATEKGRDPLLVESMAEKDIEIDGIVEKGRLLSLDYKKAHEIGFADMVSRNIYEIMDTLGVSKENVNYVEESFRVKFALYATDYRISTLLLTVGIIAIILEIFTAGFGIAGTIGFISFVLYFGGSLLAGASGWGVILIFITGIILLLIEAAAPGFGVPGVGGMICVFASIVLAGPNLTLGIISLVIALIFSIIVLTIIFKFAPRSKMFDKIILHTQERKDLGYVGTQTKDEYIGLEGIALTTLRPAGSAEFNGEKVDVVTEGSFIEKGTKIIVLKVEGMRVIVRTKE